MKANYLCCFMEGRAAVHYESPFLMTMNPMIPFDKLKRFCIYVFVGSLILAAAVAVLTVLFGQFNDLTWRVFSTLFTVIMHALISLSFIWDDDRNKTYSRLSLFINTVFVIIIASFAASVFLIWGIIDGQTIWRCYESFFVIGFASLHVDVLSKAMGKELYIDKIIRANYGFIAAVVLMLLMMIFSYDPDLLGSAFYRILAAAVIVDGTLSILTIIFYKLYLHKHPEAPDVFQMSPVANAKKPRSVGSFWIWILLIYLLFQVIVPALWAVGMVGKLGGRM